MSEAMRKQGAEMGYSIPDVIVGGSHRGDLPRKLVQTTYGAFVARPLMDKRNDGRMSWDPITHLALFVQQIVQQEMGNAVHRCPAVSARKRPSSRRNARMSR